MSRPVNLSLTWDEWYKFSTHMKEACDNCDAEEVATPLSELSVRGVFNCYVQSLTHSLPKSRTLEHTVPLTAKTPRNITDLLKDAKLNNYSLLRPLLWQERLVATSFPIFSKMNS